MVGNRTQRTRQDGDTRPLPPPTAYLQLPILQTGNRGVQIDIPAEQQCILEVAYVCCCFFSFFFLYVNRKKQQ